MTKTLRDYLEDRNFTNRWLTYDREGRNPIWFVSSRYNSIIGIEETTERLRRLLKDTRLVDEISIGIKSYHKYADGVRGGSRLILHLSDSEATEEDHAKQKEKIERHWQGLSFEEQRELVQFTYDMGGEVPKEDIIKYQIEK